MENEDFTVECFVCKQWLHNWVGSTPCCGSIAHEVNTKTGEVKKNFFLYVKETDFGAKKLKTEIK
jgi:hypothetical protein